MDTSRANTIYMPHPQRCIFELSNFSESLWPVRLVKATQPNENKKNLILDKS